MQELFTQAALFTGSLVALAVGAEIIRLRCTAEAPVEALTTVEVVKIVEKTVKVFEIKTRVRGKVKRKNEVSTLTPFGTSTRYAHALSACKYDLGDARAAGDPSKKAYKKAFAKAARQEARRYEKQYR